MIAKRERVVEEDQIKREMTQEGVEPGIEA
jgi:hypothetical protein